MFWGHLFCLSTRGQDFPLVLSLPPPLPRRVLKVKPGKGDRVIGSWSVQVALPLLLCNSQHVVPVVTSYALGLLGEGKSLFSLRASLRTQSSTGFLGADCGPCTLETGLLVELRRGC